ncbi:ribosomal-protein-alanine N-acetyltransferase [Luteitalea pratensis]|uniref:[Ribosomal protein bS18]-alanine N-acetyltransferase n=2 Tax=Luteitalea pratensis TaxID=1855912 RepID=A0A143PQB2_LUTPR|nr:ribosomal-protein-alanine N-acetyltransferase [Luteitalea pratensis]
MIAPVMIREAGAEACPAVATLESACFDVPWSITAVRSLLDDGLTRVWEARTSQATVGAAILRIVAGEGELLRIAVHPDLRRQGIGRVLLRAVLSAVADACPLGVYLEVRASNIAARHLYAREGFAENGRRKGYYDAPPEDAILMHWRPAAPAS